MSLVASAIEGSGVRHGVLIDVVLGAFPAPSSKNPLMRRALSTPRSRTSIVLATDCRTLGLSRAAASPWKRRTRRC